MIDDKHRGLYWVADPGLAARVAVLDDVQHATLPPSFDRRAFWAASAQRLIRAAPKR